MSPPTSAVPGTFGPWSTAVMMRICTSVDMSAASSLLTEDQFLCSICLDVFTDPVTIPCGHNFCKTCITEYWDIDLPYQCPNCKKGFSTKPELQVNTFISEMAAQFRQSAQQEASSSSSSEQQVSKPKEVPCDVYSGTKRRTWMFFLLCLMCVFMAWMVSDQKKHLVGPQKEEYEAKKAELWKTGAEILQMIQKRRLKIQEIKHSVELSDEDADREIAEGVEIFLALMESVERSLAELVEMIQEKKRMIKQPAEGFITELEQEISELQKRSTEVEQLLQSEDHLHLLQSFTSLNAAPPTKDWTEVNVRPPSYEGTVVKAVTQLEETLSEQRKKLVWVELKRVQQSAVDVTLDPDTAHPNLILSDDGKQVHDSDVRKNLPNNPKRFFNYVFVLAKQSFSSGRFYYEVHVKGKTMWTLGVAGESVNRIVRTLPTPHDGYWAIWLRNDNEYLALADPAVLLSLKSRPQKVGVFVDYEEGLVSFYDVDAAALIYSFTGYSFTEKLYPFFSPEPHYGGKNSAPLIISPVSAVTPPSQSCTERRNVTFPELQGRVFLSDSSAAVKTSLSVFLERNTQLNPAAFSQQQPNLCQTLDQTLVRSGNKEKLTSEQKLAEGFVKDGKKGISEPKKRNTEVEQLYVAQQKKLRKQKNLLHEFDLKRVQQYAVDVTLDPDTAHPNLILSEDGKQVKLGDVRKNFPDNPERFDTCVIVLAKQSFSSGRFYYEVQVKGKTSWDLGVARESVNRKGLIILSHQNGYWVIGLRNENEYLAAAGPAVRLSLKSRPQKVGVFVDYEEGLVSFYDVDAAALIYSFTGYSFTEKLYPYFYPGPIYEGGKNSAPLIISPVSH
ncbi:LOW QUALITY PROTEIN: E3 ubiquitin-protein ligase TRIM39-like [Sander vitreus]